MTSHSANSKGLYHTEKASFLTKLMISKPLALDFSKAMYVLHPFPMIKMGTILQGTTDAVFLRKRLTISFGFVVYNRKTIYLG